MFRGGLFFGLLLVASAFCSAQAKNRIDRILAEQNEVSAKILLQELRSKTSEAEVREQLLDFLDIPDFRFPRVNVPNASEWVDAPDRLTLSRLILQDPTPLTHLPSDEWIINAVPSLLCRELWERKSKTYRAFIRSNDLPVLRRLLREVLRDKGVDDSGGFVLAEMAEALGWGKDFIFAYPGDGGGSRFRTIDAWERVQMSTPYQWGLGASQWSGATAFLTFVGTAIFTGHPALAPTAVAAGMTACGYGLTKFFWQIHRSLPKKINPLP